jgi:GTP-dependent phosphoenolpyruvate carboxykinase
VPREGDLDLSGMDIDPESFREATAVRMDEWKQEIGMSADFFKTIGPRMPHALELQGALLAEALTYGAPIGEP